jgi:CDGSH-type Zn-finger protein/uncharacterized Fe-S cluster protein YjdI
MEKNYTNNEITVHWKSDACIHSTQCWKGLIEVFNPKQRPWINMEGAPTKAIVDQVMKCPSGALSLSYNDPARQAKWEEARALQPGGAKVYKKEPIQVEVQENRLFSWCSCGLSENSPFCDSSHRGSDFKSVKVKPEKTETVWLCQCKQTKNPPYCDGTHRSL